MPRALQVRPDPPPELPLPRLRPRKTHPNHVQVPLRKPLTLAEQKRLLRVGLPIELWREVLCHAVTLEHELETCCVDGRNYTFENPAAYRAEWREVFQTRLSLVLVCKSWNNLASEYLYRSILVSRAHQACVIIRLVLRLVNTGMIKFVQRVSVYSFHRANAPKSSLLNAIAQFPNLRVLEIKVDNMFKPEVNQTHITTLSASFQEWSAVETLAFLPHLQYLRSTFYNRLPISSRVKLSQLKTLHVQAFRGHPFYEWLDLPNLHTLIVDDMYGIHHLPLLQHFLPHIHRLGFSACPRPPPNKPSALLLRSIICRQPFGANWQNLPLVVPLSSIEEVHLSMECAVLHRSLPVRTAYTRFAPDYHIASMLAHMVDESVMQKLDYVYTDLTTNTLRIMKPKLKDELREWLTSMKKRGVTVMTYIKTSKYARHRYYSLEEVWAAEPHWEFWEPVGVLNEIAKWDLLAEVTGRSNMIWRVTKDGSECQWFGEAQ